MQHLFLRRDAFILKILFAVSYDERSCKRVGTELATRGCSGPQGNNEKIRRFTQPREVRWLQHVYKYLPLEHQTSSNASALVLSSFSEAVRNENRPKPTATITSSGLAQSPPHTLTHTDRQCQWRRRGSGRRRKQEEKGRRSTQTIFAINAGGGKLKKLKKVVLRNIYIYIYK